MNIQKTILIDLARRGLAPPIHAVEGDSGTRSVVIQLRENFQVWTVPEGVTASLSYKKADGTAGWYDTLPDGVDACAIDGDTITVELAPQVLSKVGQVFAAVVLRDEDGNQLTTFDFLIDVLSSPADSGASKDYYNLKVVASVEELAAEIEKLKKNGVGGGFVAQDEEPENTDLLWVDTSEEEEEDETSGAVLYSEAQELSGDQQARARENIGALGQAELRTAAEEVLAQAKESGEFDGADGVTPELTIGTVETLEAGSEATASIGGTAEKPVLNLGIPRGAAGESSGGGVSEDWVEIGTVTLEEDTAVWDDYIKNANLNYSSFDEVAILFHFTAAEGNTTEAAASFKFYTEGAQTSIISLPYARRKSGTYDLLVSYKRIGNLGGQLFWTSTMMTTVAEKITGFNLYGGSEGCLYGAGSTATFVGRNVT